MARFGGKKPSRHKSKKCYVLSGDSDFAEAIKIAVEDFGSHVELILPGRPPKHGNPGVSKKLLQAASRYSYLSAKSLAQAQFSDKLPKSGQNGQCLYRPVEWTFAPGEALQ